MKREETVDRSDDGTSAGRGIAVIMVAITEFGYRRRWTMAVNIGRAMLCYWLAFPLL